MTLKEMMSLFQYDRWATERTIESLSSLSEDDYTKDLKSSFGGIHGTLVHVYWADCLWLARWKGNPSWPPTNVDRVPTLDALSGRWREYREDLHVYLAGLSDSILSNPLTYRDTQGNKHSEPLYEQMQHKVNHSTHHRGQIVTMLRQLGQKPLPTDLINFYRERGS